MKINLSNHKRIYAALDIANKGAKVRTLNWNQLLEHSYACEHRLASACIAIKDRIGVYSDKRPHRRKGGHRL